jgi:hypothetical protein
MFSCEQEKIKCRQNEPVVTVHLYHPNTDFYWQIFVTSLNFGGNGVIKILHICSSFESFLWFIAGTAIFFCLVMHSTSSRQVFIPMINLLPMQEKYSLTALFGRIYNLYTFRQKCVTIYYSFYMKDFCGGGAVGLEQQ